MDAISIPIPCGNWFKTGSTYGAKNGIIAMLPAPAKRNTVRIILFLLVSAALPPTQ
ncbi:hypothetical protein GCM10008915_78010 [Bifidobacterium pullorum subsp. gallinarum]